MSFASNVPSIINQALIVFAKIELLKYPHDDILNSSQLVNATLSASLVACNLTLSIVLWHISHAYNCENIISSMIHT